MTPGKMISAADIPDLHVEKEAVGSPGQKEDGFFPLGTLREAREEFEREFIIQKLEENDWNISRTAEVIELERSNLHRKIKSYGIDVRK
jgi:two-component system nitrogen regulation response regulator NtrX